MPEGDKILTGIFGGSFDPPHEGHSGIIKSFFAEIPDCKEIFLIPNRQNPLKEKKATTSEDILGMLHLFVQEFSNPIRILDTELKKDGPSYTVETLRELKKTYSNRDFILLIGEDNYDSFHKWKDWRIILENVKFVCVFRRVSERVPVNPNLQEVSDKFTFLNNPLLPVSSTELRREFQSSMEASRVLDNLRDYIKKKDLYRK
ncbi:nicotinate-nicotinamide nucleotide adenylyltransferase [Leptospira tipperaryensis]|uniref:Probable nicotinate-nucleotide adenylyltransferase n=1 Tax=Leptospira tipperaryensis TaxID=2564040 RepID=A0A1D7UZD0_9LEPT|nr:nicotinate (nicotinamide) nucleotide adenylyltransferase [Leptospira tipperaryensis]AOP34937.1 nicotinate-nicotinamide nucleotide adenylyltransferase [Leptospira tipperaryensis]